MWSEEFWSKAEAIGFLVVGIGFIVFRRSRSITHFIKQMEDLIAKKNGETVSDLKKRDKMGATKPLHRLMEWSAVFWGTGAILMALPVFFPVTESFIRHIRIFYVAVVPASAVTIILTLLGKKIFSGIKNKKSADEQALNSFVPNIDKWKSQQRNIDSGETESDRLKAAEKKTNIVLITSLVVLFAISYALSVIMIYKSFDGV